MSPNQYRLRRASAASLKHIANAQAAREDCDAHVLSSRAAIERSLQLLGATLRYRLERRR
jgi:hypothetical protein